MDIVQAMQALGAGRYVRRDNWPSGRHLRYIIKSESTNSPRGVIHLYKENVYLHDYTFNDAWSSYDDQWEIYEPVPETMTFADALKAMKQGKRARRLAWGNENGPVYYLADYICVYGKDQNSRYDLCVSDLDAADWIITVENPEGPELSELDRFAECVEALPMSKEDKAYLKETLQRLIGKGEGSP